MSILEKMNELVGTNASKENIKNWAYMNRILTISIYLEEEFETLEKTVEKFFEDPKHQMELTEFELWDMFLDYEFVA